MKNTNLSIKEIPQNDRPRERLIKYGVKVLSDSELLAIILRTGTKNLNAVLLSQKILGHYGGLKYLNESSIQELSSIDGIGEAKASIIKAAVELGIRLNGPEINVKMEINSPKDIFNILLGSMRDLKKEHFKVIFLNVKNVIIDISDLSIGTLNSSIVHPREVFYDAIKKTAYSIIICHNHPSGDPSPSNDDIKVTKRLVEVGRLIGIEVLDHIIIGDGTYISFKEINLI